MLEHARLRDREIDWTFFCTLDSPAELEPRAKAAGAKVVHASAPIGRKLRFLAALRSELRRGRYDVLHCHHDLISGAYFLASAGLRVPTRIVHVHNADDGVPTPNALKRWLFREPLRRTCLAAANQVAGISNHTLDHFLRDRARRPGRDLVHYYGVDPSPFQRISATRAELRRVLGLPLDAPAMLFFGRMTPEKNPVFAVDVLAAIRRRSPEAVAVFAGAGSLETEVRKRAAELGQEDHVHCLGWRSDAAEVMSACDLFILPRPHSPMEGFGLAVVEAQLAGLRLLLSHGIADDPLLPNAVVRRLELDSGAEAWADAAIELLATRPTSHADALSALRASPMDLDHALDELLAIHAGTTGGS
jgi:glycosyltransferase involved in cell wall biosynthesis